MVNKKYLAKQETKNPMKQPLIKNICVYCGAGAGVRASYAAAARALGRALAKEGIGLVYGGASVGLMGEIAKAVLEGGGRVTGIRPSDLPVHETPLDNVQEFIEVQTLHERKMLMFERSDAFVALPGGVGTLEELVEQITWAQLGHHGKPVIIANIEDYWAPLVELFEKMRNLGFISKELDINYIVAERVEDIVKGAFRSDIKRIVEMGTVEGVLVRTGVIVAHNPLLATLAEAASKTPAQVPPDPQCVGALGAALLALEQSKKGEKQ